MKTARRFTYAILALAFLAVPTLAQEQTKLIDFQQHIQPILEAHCIACHGPKEQKGGQRVDDLEGLRGYIEAGDADASSLWTDYLRSQDPEMLMPPPSQAHAGGLSNADLLFIKTWINEGAVGQWKAASDQPVEVQQEVPKDPLSKVWAFQGLFHPAAVHLPIALLLVSSIFVFFSFFNRDSCEPVAYHCLWIGALGAVASCVTGWSYAVYEGYGLGFGFDLEKSDIDRHRWLGVFVAAFSVLMVPLARSVRLTADVNKKVIWMLAGLVMLVAVSVTGFQGGELTYGEGHYAKYFKQLFSADDSLEQGEENGAEESEPAANDRPANDRPANDRPAEDRPAEDRPADPAQQATPAAVAEPADPPVTKPEATATPETPSDVKQPSEVKQETPQPVAAESSTTPTAEPAVPSPSNEPASEPTKEPANEPTKEPESPAVDPSSTETLQNQ